MADAVTDALPEHRSASTRDQIPESYRWNLSDIYPDWPAWDAATKEFDGKLAGYAALKGNLAKGADRLLAAFRLSDDVERLAYRLWYYASLSYDQDQRDNSANARRQRVQILLAKAQQETSWFNPELLSIPLDAVRQWMSANPDLALYRFAIERLYHQQEHV